MPGPRSGRAGRHAEEISLPARSTADDGAFSPDGRLLALLVSTGITAAGHSAANRLVAAAVASGRVTAVPGTTISSGNGVSSGWQTGSHRLIADVTVGAPGHSRWQIAVWQPGDARLSTALWR